VLHSSSWSELEQTKMVITLANAKTSTKYQSNIMFTTSDSVTYTLLTCWLTK